MNRLTKALGEFLPPESLARLCRIAGIAEKRGDRIALVGGAVRDLIMKRRPGEMDVAVEGDAVELARAVGREMSCTVAVHRRYRNASLIFPGGAKIDLTGARRESYSRPAALPKVAPAGLEEDLARRDFTINAMAMPVDAKGLGRLIDPFGGRGDIKAGLIRVLHRRSFIDDPTRIIRAFRFAARLSFKIEGKTASLIRRSITGGGPKELQARRLAREMDMVLREEAPLSVLLMMRRSGLLDIYHPGLLATKESRALARSVPRLPAWWKKTSPDEDIQAWRLWYLALLMGLHPAAARAFFRRMDLGKKDIREDLGRMLRACARLKRKPPPGGGAVDRVCRPLRPEACLLLSSSAFHPQVSGAVRHYLTELRRLEVHLRGRDMRALGYRPGPALGKALERIRLAVLDGRIRGRDQEVDLAKKLLERNARKRINKRRSV